MKKAASKGLRDIDLDQVVTDSDDLIKILFVRSFREFDRWAVA